MGLEEVVVEAVHVEHGPAVRPLATTAHQDGGDRPFIVGPQVERHLLVRSPENVDFHVMFHAMFHAIEATERPDNSAAATGAACADGATRCPPAPSLSTDPPWVLATGRG